LNKKLSSIIASGAILLTVAPAAGTLIQVGNNVAHAEAFKAGAQATRTLKFNVKADEKVNTKTETVGEPVDLIMIIDGSGSQIEQFNSGDNPSKRKINVALGDALKLVESLPEGSQVMIASYDTNTIDSYAKKGVTKLIPKADAIKVLNDVKDSAPESKYQLEWYRVWEKYLNGAGDKIFDKSSTDRPFEETYEKDPAKKNKYVSVIQFTDEWVQDEAIDGSFADWSKSKAKTFMSVLYPKTDGNLRSETMMKAVGHPNIYNSRGKSDAARQKDIIEKFKTSGLKTNTVKTKTFPIGEVTIKAEDGISITEAYLVSPTGVKTKLLLNNNVSWSTISWSAKFEEEGEYSVVYKFSGSPTEIKKIVGDVQVSGKSVVNAVDTIEPNKSSAVDTAKEDIPFKTIEEKDPTLPLGERTVKVKGVLGERTITKTYDVLNGKRVGDPKVDTKVTKEPVDEVILVGTKVDEKVTYKTIHKGDDGKVLKEENVAAEKSEFEGYKYVKTESDNSDKLNVVTTHYYHKLITTYKGVDEKGKEVILEKVDGTKDKKDFKGYIFEKTEKLDNGDVVHHYKAKKADEKKKPVETGANASAAIMPLVGISSGVGVLGAAAYIVKRKK
jgi:surface repeat SSSPR-51 protein